MLTADELCGHSEEWIKGYLTAIDDPEYNAFLSAWLGPRSKSSIDFLAHELSVTGIYARVAKGNRNG